MTTNTLAQKEPKSQPRRVKPTSFSEADATVTREGLVASSDRVGEAIAIAVDTGSDDLVVQRLTEVMLELWRVRWQLNLTSGDVEPASAEDDS
jgi:hypothetical protein